MGVEYPANPGIDMEALSGITQQINVFVRFFESINYLFCQIRWLEQNFQNSSKTLILIVGAIAMIGLFVYYNATTDPAQNGLMFAELSRIIVSYFPIVAVVALIGYFLIRRFSDAPNGQLEGGHGMESVFMGSQRRGPPIAIGRPIGEQDRDIENHLIPKGRPGWK